jgi:hypothetical protein
MKAYKFSKLSIPIWLFLVMGVVVSLVAKIYLSSMLMSETTKDVIDEVITVIMSACLIGVILDVSNQKALIDKIIEEIQLRVAKETDYSKLSQQIKEGIIFDIYKSSMIEQIEKGNKNYARDADLAIKSLSNDRARAFSKGLESCIFYNSFSRDITIVLCDEDIEVKTITIMNVANPAKEDYKVRFDPMFWLDKEYDTYKVDELFYNGSSSLKCRTYFSNSHRKSKTNPLYVGGKKVLINISADEESQIKIATSYRTEYNMFFQSYWFKHPCAKFTLSAAIEDKRTQKQSNYILRWEFFSSLSKSQVARGKMKQEHNSIHIMQPVEWAEAGDGYILALGEQAFHGLRSENVQ